MHQNPEKYQGSQCKEALEKFSHWQDFSAKATDLPPDVRASYEGRLAKGIETVEQRITALEASLSKGIQALEEAKDLESFRFAKNVLEQLDGNNGTEKLQKKRSDLLSQGNILKKYLNTIPETIPDLQKFLARKPEADLGKFQKLFASICQKNLDELAKEEETWLKLHKINQTKRLEEMDASSCTNWLKQAGDLPSFLSGDAVARYQKAVDLVEHRLHQQRVDGVVAMFQHLTPEEQKECLARLQRP